MRFTEIGLFGVHVAPMSLLMVAAWLVTIALRRVVVRFGVAGEAALGLWSLALPLGLFLLALAIGCSAKLDDRQHR